MEQFYDLSGKKYRVLETKGSEAQLQEIQDAEFTDLSDLPVFDEEGHINEEAYAKENEPLE